MAEHKRKARGARAHGQSEAKIQADILERIGHRGDCIIWRANTGGGWVFDRYGNATPVTFGVAGQADITGAVAVRGAGVRLEIEVKSSTGTQRESQKNYEAWMNRIGAIYILARSAEEAEEKLEKAIAEIVERMDGR